MSGDTTRVLPARMTLAGLLLALVLLGLVGLSIGSAGWQSPWHASTAAGLSQIVWEIRAPRTLGAILVGAAAVQFKKGSPPLPTETFDSVVKDAHAIKGDDNNGV